MMQFILHRILSVLYEYVEPSKDLKKKTSLLLIELYLYILTFSSIYIILN